MTYAADTSVSVERSRMEIERTLTRYGAQRFVYASEPDRAAIGFTIRDRMVRFVLALPDPKDRRFTHHSRGARTAEAAHKEWEQACRQKWRALALVIKAKLEAVEAQITTVEEEFLAHTVLPDGRLFGQWAKPQIDQAYLTGASPSPLLLSDMRS